MITYVQTDIFRSPAQTLVNTVNTIGVMGKGIAKEFKSRYPEMFYQYKKICDSRDLTIGNLHLWRGADKWILNFPTKTTWQKPSDIEYIKLGLKKFVETYEQMGITSISFPPLGCGNGQLDWSTVKPIIEKYLEKLPIQIFIHEVTVSKNFVPEHLENRHSGIPATFENFLSDINSVLYSNKGNFETLSKSSYFDASFVSKDKIKIQKQSGDLSYIPLDAMLTAWSTLQIGVLSIDQFNDSNASRYKSYLFPILAELPYVDVTISNNTWDEQKKYALMLRSQQAISEKPEQGTLWQSL